MLRATGHARMVMRNLVKDHETRLSIASVSKLCSGDKPRVKRVSQQNLRNLQRDVEKLKEIDPDYLKTLNRHNNTVDVSFTQTDIFIFIYIHKYLTF